MTSAAYLMLVLWPSVFAGNQASFECSLHRPKQDAVVKFTAAVNSKGELLSDVIQTFGDTKPMIGAPQKKPEIIVTSGLSNRFIWLFGDQSHGYSFEMTDYPPSGEAHFLLTEHGVSGGRHAFDRFAGYGTCNLALEGRSMNR